MSSAETGPALSVVTATRNRPDWLRDALRSVEAQTLADMEALVIDDGSDQANLDKLAGWWPQLDSRFKFFPPAAPGAPGTGPAAARNRGIEAAAGRYLTFLDDDDRWLDPGHLALAVRMLDGRQADLFFVNMQGENAGVPAIPDWFPRSPWLTAGPRVHDSPEVYEVSLAGLARTMHHHYPHPNGCVFRRELLKRVGGFWEKIGIAEDYDLVLRLADKARKILYRPDRVVGYNITPRSSAFTRTSPIDRSLQCIEAARHVRACCGDRHVLRCARATEWWHLRQVSDALAAQGKRAEALAYAFNMWRVYPSPGSSRAALVRLLRMGK